MPLCSVTCTADEVSIVAPVCRVLRGTKPTHKANAEYFQQTMVDGLIVAGHLEDCRCKSESNWQAIKVGFEFTTGSGEAGKHNNTVIELV